MKAFVYGWLIEFGLFVASFGTYLYRRYLVSGLLKFELLKSLAVVKMYQQRGRYAQLTVHASMVLIMVLGVSLGPSLVVNDGRVRMSVVDNGRVSLALAAEDEQVLGEQTQRLVEEGSKVLTLTQVSDKPRSEIIEYEVVEGDTLSTIANKFAVSVDTLRWANPDKIKTQDSIKPGEVIEVPPVTGLVHEVKSGETIYSIAKKYDSDPQSIVDFPFNEFTNDETFALAIGQSLVVPDGVMPKVQPWSPGSSFARILTPDAGSVSATGSWLWPTAGQISQPFRAWHKGVDIANRSGGAILASDSGVVVVAGWLDNSGYGNRVMIDHGNGYQTLYAHMSRIAVQLGQSVKRGDKIGDMGSTGRSTGTHLHFEVRSSGGNLDPLTLLR